MGSFSEQNSAQVQPKMSFVEKFREQCITTHEKMKYAKEIESEFYQKRVVAEELTHDVDMAGRAAQHEEDELMKVLSQIALTESQLKDANHREAKTTKILAELQSRLKIVENDVVSKREELKNKDEKLEAVLDFIQQERAERKVQDKLNFDAEVEYDNQYTQLNAAIASAEDYTNKFEDMKKRIATQERELKKQVDRGDKAEERVQMMEAQLKEMREKENNLHIQSIQDNANEDNLLEDVRQKRQALYDSEQRFEFAEKCRRELQAIADDLSGKYEVEKKNFEGMSNADL